MIYYISYRKKLPNILTVSVTGAERSVRSQKLEVQFALQTFLLRHDGHHHKFRNVGDFMAFTVSTPAESLKQVLT